MPTLGRVGRDDCGFRKALFTECRPVLDAWAPQLGEAFLRFAPRPEEDRNFVRTCPRWDFATFASFARAAQFEHLGIPVEEDSFLLQTVYGHARQGPVTADGRLIADGALAGRRSCPPVLLTAPSAAPQRNWPTAACTSLTSWKPSPAWQPCVSADLRRPCRCAAPASGPFALS